MDRALLPPGGVGFGVGGVMDFQGKFASVGRHQDPKPTPGVHAMAPHNTRHTPSSQGLLSIWGDFYLEFGQKSDKRLADVWVTYREG